MGILSRTALQANTTTKVYTCPASTNASININVCNRGADCDVKLALTAGSAPEDSDWIEYNYPLPQYGVIERTGIVLSAGQAVYAWASSAYTNIVIVGVESLT